MVKYTVILLALLMSFDAGAQKPNEQAAGPDYTQLGSGIPFFRMKIADTIDTNAVIIKKRQKNGEVEVPIRRVVSLGDVSGKGNLLFMLFSPTCDHCEATTRQFVANMSLFHESKLVLITNPKFGEYLPDFMRKLHTDHFPQMYVGIDDSDFLKETFLYQTLPQINVYNRQRKLIKIFTGEMPIDSVKAYID